MAWVLQGILNGQNQLANQESGRHGGAGGVTICQLSANPAAPRTEGALSFKGARRELWLCPHLRWLRHAPEPGKVRWAPARHAA